MRAALRERLSSAVSVPFPRSFAPGARRYAAPPLFAGIVLLSVSALLGLAVLALGAAVLAFFRDPDRRPSGEGILAPADGRVSVLREEGGRLRVGVFMNVHDVHVVRAPRDGTVESVEHSPGAHRPAFTKESDRNERLDVAFEAFDLSLIAGWFARRIHPYVEAGDAVERGERVGHIAFGSRVDVLLPEGVDAAAVVVSEGDRVRAGETIVAPEP